MQPVNIPIRSLAPEPADSLDVLPMPREMSTFEMPRLPVGGPDTDLDGARVLLADLLDRMAAWLAGAGEPPTVDLAGLPTPVLKALNDTLGEGEVSAIVEARHEIRIQETVFPGLWREQHLRDHQLLHDHLLAAAIPPLVGAAASARASPLLRPLPLPAGAMNVPALISELQDAMDRCAPGVPAHVLNLTLLPLSPEDAAHLDAVLDGGSVVVLSRGFGNCRISSTAARHVWRVQYFNTMQTLILNTLEVVSVPEVALAAREDLVETHERLADLVRWMADPAQAA